MKNEASAIPPRPEALRRGRVRRLCVFTQRVDGGTGLPRVNPGVEPGNRDSAAGTKLVQRVSETACGLTRKINAMRVLLLFSAPLYLFALVVLTGWHLPGHELLLLRVLNQCVFMLYLISIPGLCGWRGGDCLDLAVASILLEIQACVLEKLASLAAVTLPLLEPVATTL